MTLYIRTQSGHQYHVLDTGDIVRLDIEGFQPSGQWKMQGIRHCKRTRDVLTLGTIRRAFGPSEVWPTKRPELLYKNGKPQWRMIDLDHGTTREWSDGITEIRKLAA